MLILRDLKKTMGRLMIEINLEIKEGEIIELKGPNGSGKSTLLKIIAGIIKPDAGRIYYNNVEITSWSPEKRRFPLISGPNDIFKHMKVIDNIYFANRISNEELMNIINILDLEKILHKNAGELSDGMKIRVLLARAIASGGRILLIDEALSYLDNQFINSSLSKLFNYLKKKGISIINVTHYEFYHDRKIYLEGGRIKV